ncbi:hypothetical protein V6N13_079799 [Hibiscus sabdariffa]
MKMATSVALSRLILFLFFTYFAAVSAATSTTTTLRPHSGFIYSRTRGRCTPQFWSSRREAWPRMVPHGSTVTKVFGSRASERFRSDMTLLEERAGNEDVFSELLKQASAALLNSYARKGFPYSAWEVKTLMIQGLVSESAAARLTKRFSVANDAWVEELLGLGTSKMLVYYFDSKSPAFSMFLVNPYGFFYSLWLHFLTYNLRSVLLEPALLSIVCLQTAQKMEMTGRAVLEGIGRRPDEGIWAIKAPFNIVEIRVYLKCAGPGCNESCFC